jgi:hypothetical protein
VATVAPAVAIAPDVAIAPVRVASAAAATAPVALAAVTPLASARGSRLATALPPRKPMALARRVSLFEREVSLRLAPVAIELIHGAARMLTEGELDGDAYAGSTMLTIDLTRTADRISDPLDASTAQRVAVLYGRDERCRERARRIALGEALRQAGCPLTSPRVDVESRARGAELHLSVNVEAQRRTSP